jgi:UDP-3-O-[3-hydroxymyristoyl] glucosamine N-acyltransferase
MTVTRQANPSRGGDGVAVGMIIEYLAAEGLVERAHASHVDPDAVVCAVSTDEEAGPGDLAWLSPRVLTSQPARLTGFRGTLLLVPQGTEVGEHNVAALPTRDPKLALTTVVARFLPELTRTEWPRPGETLSTVTIGRDVALGPGVVLGSNTTIGNGVTIGPNTCIANAQIGDGVTIGANCTIGLAGFGYRKVSDGGYVRFPHIGSVVIESGVEIGSNTCIDRGALGSTVIKRGAKIDNLVHIAHNVIIGEDTLVIAHAMIGGSAIIGDRAWIAPTVSVMNQIEIGADAVVGLGAVVVKSVAAGTTVVGNPAKPLVK